MPLIVEPTQANLAEAVRRLRQGSVVAFPTETVYGLGADTFNPAAINQVYELKGRPADNPLIAHVFDTAQARQVVRHWDARCDRLAELFWPGPLTLVLEKVKAVPAVATAGRNTVAVRSPAHPVARSLLKEFGSPISAPSANRSGCVSPTTAQHVADDFAGHDLLVLNGGPCELGVESTVLDLTKTPPIILRPGSVTLEQLREMLGDVQAPDIAAQRESPGTAPSHYAPRTPAELVNAESLPEKLVEAVDPMAVLCFDQSRNLVKSPHCVIVMPSDAEGYAAALYQALRDADHMGCARMLIERPQETTGVWRAVIDRLTRAAAR